MQEVLEQLKKTKEAARLLRTMAGDTKNLILHKLALKLKNQGQVILAANEQDVKAYENSASFQRAFADRLSLSPLRIKQMIESIEAVIAADNPVGQSLGVTKLENGLLLERIRGPLGVCFMIFESRPNVITEAFALALKSSNALILKGGKESDTTAQSIYKFIAESIREVTVLDGVFWGLLGASRATTDFLMRQNQYIDVLIPRGGDRLLEYVSKNSNLPMIKNEKGLCHIYVHKNANLEMALKIIENAKTQRPGVCNAMETLLLDDIIAPEFLPKVYQALVAKGVEFYVCELSQKILNGAYVHLATETSFDTEYLDLKINIKVVNSSESAQKHIEIHGSRHSEAIITEDSVAAEDFLKKVDASVVYWNASTRFTDGYQFGLGGEIGVSTQKLHVRGPVGLEALTVPRWIVKGQGQIRQ